MTIQQAQQEVDQWIKTIGVRYFSELTNMAILTEEVGELAQDEEQEEFRDQFDYQEQMDDNQENYDMYNNVCSGAQY